MQLTKKSGLSGKEHTRELPLTPEEYGEGLAMWVGGMTIQAAFPTLSDDDREFIKTGITPEEWNAAFPEE